MIEVVGLEHSREIEAHGDGRINAFADGTVCKIRGWAIGDGRTATRVEVHADGNALSEAPIALDRPDVTRALGDLPGAARSGFEVILEPTRSGSCEMIVYIVFEYGEPVELGRIRVTASVAAQDSAGTGPLWSAILESDERGKVLLGQNGWLFLRRDRNDVIGQLTGKVRLSRKDKRALARLLKRRKTIVTDAEALWLTAIVPDKEVLYAEHLPTDVIPAARRTVHDFLDIAAEADAPVTYLLDDLRAAKSFGELYIRTDTHWNHRGAYVAYRAICRELGSRGVELDTVEEQDIAWSDVPFQGDLGGKLYPELVESTDTRATLSAPRGRRTYDNQIINHGRVLVHEQELTGGLTCVLFGESFAAGLLPFLAESFRRVVFVHTSMLVPEVLGYERPDVVLSVPIERFVRRLPDDEDAFAVLVATARDKGGMLPWPVDGGSPPAS